MSKSHETTKKTVHVVWVYPEIGAPHEEFFSSKVKAHDFQSSTDAKTSYSGTKRVNFTGEYPIYDKNVFHIDSIDYRVE